MEIYVTRHGKTEWNVARRFQGMYGDSPLLPASYEEIAKLGQHIATVPFEAIYCSTALRAFKTAEGIAAQLDQQVPIIQDEALLEMGYGTLEGQLIDEMRQFHANEMDHMRFHMDRYNPAAFQGETVDAMITRMTQFMTSRVQAHQGPILFVGHGSSMTAAVQALIGKSAADYRAMGGLFNNSLTILETETKEVPYQLKLWNDASFLEDSTTLDALL